MMTISSQADVSTPHGKRYAAQLGKHWAHAMAVEEDGDIRRITFPRNARGADWPGDGIATLTPAADALICRIDASAPGQLEALQGAIERHIDRFAFREDPLAYDWRSTTR